MSEPELRTKVMADLTTWPVERLLGSEIGWVRILAIEIEELNRDAQGCTFTACIQYDELETTSCTNPPLSSSFIKRIQLRVLHPSGEIERTA